MSASGLNGIRRKHERCAAEIERQSGPVWNANLGHNVKQISGRLQGQCGTAVQFTIGPGVRGLVKELDVPDRRPI